MKPLLFCDKNCQYVAKPLREIGYDVETVTGVRRPGFMLARDSSIVRYCQQNGRTIITAGMGMYWHCRRNNFPIIAFKDFNRVLSGVEAAIAVDRMLAKPGSAWFDVWLSAGRLHWDAMMHASDEGDWGKITQHTRAAGKTRTSFTDQLGYPLNITYERFVERREKARAARKWCVRCMKPIMPGDRRQRQYQGADYHLHCYRKTRKEEIRAPIHRLAETASPPRP
jgi:hypothetical protein